jgi:hypothetical protein
MAANVKIDIAAEFVGKKAFTDAAKQTVGLNNQVKTLAKSYLGLFTAQRLGRAGFNAAKAFAADDKAARVLTQSLDNLGLAFADPSVRNFIADLEKQFGVLDDQLRPAYQRLLTTTGDLAKSQKLLRTALDLSAASGADVVTVAGDLSKAYVGQTRSLAKYGLGLTQAELKAMEFEQVQDRINTLFGGQAQNAVDTYAGSFAKLAVSVNNAKEAIGRGLLDALAALGGGGEGGLQNTLKLIEKTSTALETFIRRFGVGLGQAKALLSGNLSAFRAIGEAEANRGVDRSGITPSIRAELQKAAAEKAAAKNRTALVKTTKEQTKAIKEQTALTKAGTLFDIQQTQIVAALKGKITEDERKRLELQLAILTGNTNEASKLAYELARAQGITEGLAKYLAGISQGNPFAAWATYLDQIEKKVKSISMSQLPVAGGAMPSTNVPVDTSGAPVNYGYTAENPSFTYGQGNPLYITVNNAGSVVTQNDLVEDIRNGLLGNSLSGSPSSIGRLKGSFAG